MQESMSQVLPAVEAVGEQIQQAMSELAQEVQEVAGIMLGECIIWNAQKCLVPPAKRKAA